jgi:hypothetical protein
MNTSVVVDLVPPLVAVREAVREEICLAVTKYERANRDRLVDVEEAAKLLSTSAALRKAMGAVSRHRGNRNDALRCGPPPGRVELVSRTPAVVIDYAHSPDVLERTIAAARLACRGRVSPRVRRGR